MYLARYLPLWFCIDFAAKVQWRMKYDRNPLLVTLQDKYKVRDFASSRGVGTATLLCVTGTPESIPFGSLPANYLIKANHGWRWNILCLDSRFYYFSDGQNLVDLDGGFLDKDSLSEYQLTEKEVVEMCKAWLDQRHSEQEWAYQHIDPKIIVEEFLVTKDRTELKDYRLYTFDGVVKAISVGSPSFRKNKTNIFLDTEWKELPLTSYKEVSPPFLPERPDCLPELINSAQKLGAGIDFARIDLYDTSKGVMLGEITIYPEAGSRCSPTSCLEFNRWLGSHWKISRIDTLKVYALYIASVVKFFFGRCFRSWRKLSNVQSLHDN